MRKFRLMLALSCVGVGFSGMASAQSLEAADCRPLTQENARACCAAANWQDLILSRDEDLCRDLGFSQPFAAAPPNINLPETPDTPDTPDPPDPTNPPGGTASLGNPGNEPGINGPDSEVGRSGENPPRDGGGGFGATEAKGNSD
jgi:hypothetical protein